MRRATFVRFTSILALLLAVGRAGAVTFSDPALFVRDTWTLGDLGTGSNPPPPGGLTFSADGNTLYLAVTPTNAGVSRLYAVTVARTAGRVTDLSGAALVFEFTNPDSGFDAGLAFGPGGNLFFAHYPANLLVERLPNLLTERSYDMAALTGLATSVDGITFSPFRTDADTGFGRLQVSRGEFGHTVYEICLPPDPVAPAGFYEPTASLTPPCTLQPFVRVLGVDIGGIDYVPGGGTYAGDLLYASTFDGDLRAIDIDHATGLPFNTSGVPTLGTTDPRDVVLASGLQDANGGPLGLAFDVEPTGDLFVSTFEGTPANTILQIGGFEIGGTTSTSTSSSTSTTSSSSSSTSTSTSSSSTTSTSLPGATTSTSTSSSSTTPTPSTTSTSTSSSSTTPTSSSSTTSTSLAGGTTTTSTSLPGTSTSTTLPVCPVAGCNDNEPCTEDTCDPVLGCQYTPLTEYAAVACRCAQALPPACLADVLPPNLESGRARACDLVAEAGTDPGHARRLLLRAGKVANRLRRKATRAGRHGLLSPECSPALAQSFLTFRDLARDYARSLPRP